MKTINHNRLYTLILLTLAPLCALSVCLPLYLYGLSSAGSLHLHLPDGLLPWAAAINLLYLIAITVTLCSRAFNAQSGRKLTRYLNFLLLPALPVGTVLGIYGLWKIDHNA